MANVKISQLPAVGAVTGTDVLPVVASTTTSKLSVIDLANSLPTVTSSLTATSASHALVADTVISASYALSASWAPASSPIDTSAFATTGSNNFTGDQHIATNLYVTGSSTFAGIAVRPVGTTYGGFNTLIDSSNGVIQFGKADQSSEFTIEISGSSLYGNNWPTNLIVSDPGLTILTGLGKTVDIGTTLIVTGSTKITNGNLLVQEDATDVGGGFFVSAASDYITFAQQNSSPEFSIALSGSGLFPFGFRPTVTRLYSTKGFQIVTNAGQTTQISSSVLISGSLTAASITGSLFGTSSWAVSASWAPASVQALAVTASGTTIYSSNPATSNFSTNNSILLGANAGNGATLAQNSIFIGQEAGKGASGALQSNFIGRNAGSGSVNAYSSNFLGAYAGNGATNAINSNFFGVSTGENATNASYSNFIGETAGYNATNAENSTFMGNAAGSGATEASRSVFIGPFAGLGAIYAANSVLIGSNAGQQVTGNGVGPNNIIIGTNISLENDRRDSINLGGIIFATGSYSDTAGNPFTGAMIDAKVGINRPLPQYTLDVSGSGNFAANLTVSGSFIVTGSFVVPAQLDANPQTGSMYVDPAANELWVFTGNSATGWVTASLGI